MPMNTKEEHKRESEGKFEIVFRNSLDAILIIHTSDGTIKDANPAVQRILGYHIHDLIEEDYRILLPLESKFQYEKLSEELAIHDAVVQTQDFCCADGSTCYLNLTASLIPWDDDEEYNAILVILRDVKEHSEITQAIQRNEIRYRTLFEESRDFVYISTAEGRFVDVNPAGIDLFGYSHEELIGLKLEQLYQNPEDRQRFKQRIEANGFVRNFYAQIIRKDGKVLDCVETSTIRRGEDGTIIGYQGTVRDITELKTAERDLRKSEEKFRLLAENIPGVIYMCKNDAHWTMLYLNDEVENLTGYPKEDFLSGRINFPQLFHPDDAPNIRPSVGNALAEKKQYHLVYRLKHKSGQWRWIEEVGIGVSNGDGILFLEGFLSDITERRVAEESRRQLAAAIDAAAESVVITDTDGTIIYVNPAFKEISGYSAEEIIGGNPRILKSGKQDSSFYERMWKGISDGQVWSGRVINRKKDGTLYNEEMTISPVFDSNDKIVNYIAVKRDITKELILEEQLRQAVKMEAVGRLASGVAHDFNNMLTIIGGYLELTLMSLEPDNPLRENLEESHHVIGRASNLTRQLLALSTKQKSEPKVLCLNDIIVDIEGMLKRILSMDMTLETVLEPNLWQVKADPGQLEQVLLNLVVNARDAMVKGCKLTIGTSNIVVSFSDASRHPVLEEGSYVLLTVMDNGHGMIEDVKSRVFDPFFTTKGSDKGTGLGLFTVYGIVKQNRGHILVESEPDVGSIFKIYLMKTTGKIEVTPPSRRLSDIKGGNETILVVDDDDGVRGMIVRILKYLNYKVIDVGSSQEVCALSNEMMGSVDLVICDVIMPKVSGPQVMECLRDHWHDMKILYMSGHSEGTTFIQEFMDDPNVTFLHKPFGSLDLALKVREMLDAV